MGKGDIRSRRGKIFRGTFGKSRPHKVEKAVKTATTEKTESPKAEDKA